jgi:hypothetical protein
VRIAIGAKPLPLRRVRLLARDGILDRVEVPIGEPAATMTKSMIAVMIGPIATKVAGLPATCWTPRRARSCFRIRQAKD